MTCNISDRCGYPIKEIEYVDLLKKVKLGEYQMMANEKT